VRTVRLTGTEIVTTAVGFGCAGLFRLSRRSERRAVLEAAYDAGLRHFDVAPMYGLGMAEAELAPILRRRRDETTVTTKFGIDASVVGRGAARMQRPVRAVLARLPTLQKELKVVGRGPGSGSVGRLLYASAGYSARSAASSLDRSLRALATDYVDVFLLHDPVGDLSSGAPDLVAYLNEQCELGRIRCWGVTGGTGQFQGVAKGLLEQAQVLQFRADMFDLRSDTRSSPAKARVIFGVMERALPALRQFFTQFPEQRDLWSGRLGLDLGDRASLPTLVLRDALRRSVAGPVLFSTTRVERVRAAATVAAESRRSSSPDEDAEIGELARAVRCAFPELDRIP
jgi:D-threo-aldose 1-dehydrogenase